MERDIGMSKIIDVDGYTYLVTHPDPVEAWNVGMELLKMIGGPAAAMATGAKDEASAAQALSVAVNGLLSKIDGPTSLALLKRLFRYVEVQGKVGEHTKKMLLDDAGFKVHFVGRPGSILKLAGKVIEFTHTDFFSAVGDGIADLMKMVAEKTG